MLGGARLEMLGASKERVHVIAVPAYDAMDRRAIQNDCKTLSEIHLIEVLDVHDDVTQALPNSNVEGVKSSIPKLSPHTLASAPPVCGVFELK
jgi:hypothetical protein